jgi:hypothetical protein
VGLQAAEDYLHVIRARLRACARSSVSRKERILTTGQHAVQLITQYFPDDYASRVEVVELWARLQAQTGSVEDARASCWLPLLKQPVVAKNWDILRRYLAWERDFGGLAGLRSACAGLLERKKNALELGYKINVAERLLEAEEDLGSARSELAARGDVMKLRIEAWTTSDESGEKRKEGTAPKGAGQEREKGRKRKRGEGAAGAEVRRSEAGRGGVHVPTGKDGTAAPKQQYTDECTIFVKHLNMDVEEEDLRQIFPVRCGWACLRQLDRPLLSSWPSFVSQAFDDCEHVCRVQQTSACCASQGGKVKGALTFNLLPRGMFQAPLRRIACFGTIDTSSWLARRHLYRAKPVEGRVLGRSVAGKIKEPAVRVARKQRKEDLAV